CREAGRRHAAGSRSSREPRVVTPAGADDGGVVGDVPADPRARLQKRRSSERAVEHTFYRLADEPREVIFVACSKCDWKAASPRDDLLASAGVDCPMPSLLDHLAAPGCVRIGSQWDRCGVHCRAYRNEPVTAALNFISLQNTGLPRGERNSVVISITDF